MVSRLTSVQERTGLILANPGVFVIAVVEIGSDYVSVELGLLTGPLPIPQIIYE
jgi:hypothetical protein